jgi:hypothetical protein
MPTTNKIASILPNKVRNGLCDFILAYKSATPDLIKLYIFFN